MEPSKQPRASDTNRKIAGGAISLIVVALAVFGLSRNKTEHISQAAPITSTTSVASVTPSAFKDGIYSATGSYDTPAGTEHVGVTLTLKNGVVNSAQVVSEAKAPESKRYQSMFIGGYTPYVVGKSITELNLDKVSGSSLTPHGFDDAVTKIKTQAQA